MYRAGFRWSLIRSAEALRFNSSGPTLYKNNKKRMNNMWLGITSDLRLRTSDFVKGSINLMGLPQFQNYDRCKS